MVCHFDTSFCQFGVYYFVGTKLVYRLVKPRLSQG